VLVFVNVRRGEAVTEKGDVLIPPDHVLQSLRKELRESGNTNFNGLVCMELLQPGEERIPDEERNQRSKDALAKLFGVAPNAVSVNDMVPLGVTPNNDVCSEDSGAGETPQEEIVQMTTQQKPQPILDSRGNIIAGNLPDITKMKVGIERQGDKIILPPGMPLPTVLAVVLRQMDTEERIVESSTAIDSYPLDLARALTLAVERRYNFVATKNSIGMFGMEIAPPLVGLEVNPGAIEQVYWGRIPLPGFTEDEYVEAGATIKGGIWVGTINLRVKGKNKPAVDELIDLVRQILATESVYKGKAVKVEFTPADPRKGFNPAEQPRFLDLSSVKGTSDLVLADDVMAQVDMNIFTIIEKTDVVAALGVPRKRGVLLEGPYGTGKSLTALVTAKLCEQNGWTFLYLKSVKSLSQAIQFARIFGRTVIFAEDIDTVFKEGNDDAVTELRNTMDGIDTKNSEVMVVLTTNNIDEVPESIRRHGRFDAIINIAKPDARAAERLLRKYGAENIDPNEDLSEVANLLAGKNAAAAEETIKRARLAAARQYTPGQQLQLSGQHLLTAAKGMLYHFKLLESKQEDTRKPLEILGEAIGSELNRVVKTADGSVTTASDLKTLIEDVINTMRPDLAKNGRKSNGQVVGETA
jgi:transitional endoplasmic reticulum ATPase